MKSPENNGQGRQITEKSARRILGKAAQSYSQEQLQDIVDRLYGVAEIKLRDEDNL